MNRIAHTREGTILYNPNDRYIGGSITAYGEYSELEAELLRQVVKPGQVVVEVGANIGTHTLVLAKAVGPMGLVIAYEPQRAMFQLLCANMALNDVMNVDARPIAVGATDGTTRIPVPDYSQPGNFGGVSLDGNVDLDSNRRVPLSRLDVDFLSKSYWPRVHLIKIDVEGMEGDVIKGASMLIRERRPILYVENDRLPKSVELIELIWSFGYRCYWHLPPMFNPNNFAGNPENIWQEGLVSVNMLCIHRDRPADIEGLVLVEHAQEHPLLRNPRP